MNIWQMGATGTRVRTFPLKSFPHLKAQSGPVGKARKASVARFAEKEAQKYVDLLKIAKFSLKHLLPTLKVLMLQMGPYITGDQLGPSARLLADSQCKTPIHTFPAPRRQDIRLAAHVTGALEPQDGEWRHGREARAGRSSLTCKH